MVLVKFPPSHLLRINSDLQDLLKLNSLGTVISSKMGIAAVEMGGGISQVFGTPVRGKLVLNLLEILEVMLFSPW